MLNDIVFHSELYIVILKQIQVYNKMFQCPIFICQLSTYCDCCQY